jgi:hypothetical protein
MSRLTKKFLALAALALLVCGADARAQGSRKDDVVFNAQGRPMAGATVRVCTSAATGQPCSPLALIYSDAGLTQALANPTTTDGMGNYNFYAAPGRYEIEISGPSITTKQIPNVILPSDPTAPTFTTVTTTSGISAFSLSLSGNLTVSGSAAVTGSLTVGGAAVPSTTADNQWTSAQRFKGPIPWRDITAYMPAGGCDNSAISINQNTSGGISAASTALTLTADLGFKNGCGIFVQGAGATSTLTAPTTTGAPSPIIYGGAGSTTVHYKVAAIDPHLGTSAASSAIAVTTAPATRTPLDMVAIYWAYDAGAVGYLVWSDATGSYTPLGYSFQCSQFSSGGVCGYIDKGAETFNFSKSSSFPFFPYTPPASATGDALITTIVSGAGTTSLVLANAATNTVGPSAYVYPDARPFVDAALAAAATDGTSLNRGQVFIPEGLWYLSGVDFPSSPAGASIVQNGAIQLFGLPIFGTAGSGFTGSGGVSWFGNSGAYSSGYWTLSTSSIFAQTQVGAIFVAYGTPNNMDLEHLTLSSSEDVVVENSQGALTMRDDEVIENQGSGVDLRIDANTFFSQFYHVDWNSTINSNTQIPLIWYTGLTSSLQSAVFGFHDNAFRYHTIRNDNIFGGNSFGTIAIDGATSIESNWDQGLITSANSGGPGSVSISGQVSDNDPNIADQSLNYNYGSLGPIPGVQWNVSANLTGFVHYVWGAQFNGNATECTGWAFNDTSTLLNGKWGSVNGTTYTGCDLGATSLGYDVQTSGVLTSGGNDPSVSAFEPMLGHVFRRPIPSVTGTGSGSLSAGTYYFVVTILDVAGRESGGSAEISQIVGASSSISLSVAEPIYFPTSCNIYYGTSAGGEAHYFNSASVTNGTCTYTFTTTTGSTAGTPPIVGNAMRSWLTEENNGNSCLFCGLGGGLGTGFLGFNLTAAQYAAPPTGVQFPFNGGVHSYKFYSASETTAPAGIAGVDELYADSTAHRWKKIENNGVAQTVGSADSTACAYQGPASAITGTGAATIYYTCTLPAGVMGAGQGIIITALAKHTTGTVGVTYTLSFGGTSTTAVAPSGSANQLERITYLIMNNPGSTSAQTISTVGQDSSGGTNSIKLDTAAVNTTSAVTINLQFNVASTDAITPEMFLVELKQ